MQMVSAFPNQGMWLSLPARLSHFPLSRFPLSAEHVVSEYDGILHEFKAKVAHVCTCQRILHFTQTIRGCAFEATAFREQYMSEV